MPDIKCPVTGCGFYGISTELLKMHTNMAHLADNTTAPNGGAGPAGKQNPLKLKCPEMGCEYTTGNQEAGMSIELLKMHRNMAHSTGNPTSQNGGAGPVGKQKNPKLNAPKLQGGVSQQEFDMFKKKWDTYVSVTDISEELKTVCLINCLEETLSTEVHNADNEIATRTEEEVLKLIESLAVLSVSTTVQRTDLMALKQNHGEPINRFAARVTDQARTCGSIGNMELIKRTIDDFENMRRDVKKFLNEAADFIDENNRSKNKVKLATSSLSAAGGGLSIAGGAILLTAATGGLALPFLLAGAAVGVASGTAEVGNSWVKDGKKKNKMEMGDYAIQIYNQRSNQLLKLINDLPDEQKEKIKGKIPDCVFVRNVGAGEVLTKVIVDGNATAKEGAETIGKASSATVAKIGIGLNTALVLYDTYTFATTATQLYKNKPTEAAEILRNVSKDVFANVGEQRREHILEETQYNEPTYCHHCKGLIWGLYKQGVKCFVCQFDFHQKCRSNLHANCSGIKTYKLHEESMREHSLEETTYKSPTYCDYCKQLLWGLKKQGLFCSQCQVSFHHKCILNPWFPNSCKPTKRSMDAINTLLCAEFSQDLYRGSWGDD